MAFPVVEEVTATGFGTTGQTFAIPMPATVNAGDLLLMIVGFAYTGTVRGSTPTGWTEIGRSATSTDGEYTVFAKAADGTEDGTTVSYRVSFANTYCCAQVYRIQVGSWVNSGTLTNDIKHATSADTGADTTAPDSPNLSPGWTEDTLWVTFGSLRITNITAAPASYTNGVETDDTTGTPYMTLYSARRELKAASENPGGGTSSASVTENAGTLAIRPAATASYTPRMSLMGVG